MDFLNAYKEAKQFGFTKEEFFQIWQKEATLKRIIALKNLSNKRSETEKDITNRSVEDTSLRADALLLELKTETSEQSQILNPDIDELKSVSSEIKHHLDCLKAGVLDLNRESCSLDRQKVKEISEHTDFIKSELDNLRARLNQENETITKTVESHLAMFHQEIKSMLQQITNKVNRSDGVLPTPLQKHSESSTSDLTNINSTNGQLVQDGVSPVPVCEGAHMSKTIPTTAVTSSLQADCEMLPSNSLTKFTRAVHFVSNFAPKLIFGELPQLVGDLHKSYVDSLHDFTNNTITGSSVDADTQQSSVDASHLLEKQPCDTDQHQWDSRVTSFSALSMNEKGSDYNNVCVTNSNSNNNVNISKLSLKFGANNIFQTNMYEGILKENTNLNASISLNLTHSNTLGSISKINQETSLTGKNSTGFDFEGKKTFDRHEMLGQSLNQSPERKISKSTRCSNDLYTDQPKTDKSFKTSAISLIHRPSKWFNGEKLTSYIPKYGDYFYMSSKQSLHEHSHLFYSSFYTIAKTSLRVRLCHYFNDNSELCVCAQFSSVPSAKSEKRSVTLTGEGFISCGIAGGFRISQIWQLETFECHMLTDSQELSVKANVCLIEQKAPVTPVTFKALVFKGYDWSGYFEFYWHVKEVESK